MRAFLAAPLLGVGDDPTSVHKLLHSNPTFARACGYYGSGALISWVGDNLASAARVFTVGVDPAGDDTSKFEA